MTDHAAFMRRALALARDHAFAREGGPFGAVVVRGDDVVGEGWNTVARDHDPTAHAEVNALRDAARRLGTFDLTGCVLYATTEPCPMCLGAALWSRVSALHFGNDRDAAARIGFDDARFHAAFHAEPARLPMPVAGGLLADEVDALFDAWMRLPDRPRY